MDWEDRTSEYLPTHTQIPSLRQAQGNAWEGRCTERSRSVPDRAGWVNLRYPTPNNPLKSIHSGLEGFSYGGYPPRPEGHPCLEKVLHLRRFYV